MEGSMPESTGCQLAGLRVLGAMHGGDYEGLPEVVTKASPAQVSPYAMDIGLFSANSSEHHHCCWLMHVAPSHEQSMKPMQQQRKHNNKKKLQELHQQIVGDPAL